MKACPVCGKAGLADDERVCPQCNADLECFVLLDSLHEEAVLPEQHKPKADETKELAEIQVSLRGLREALGNLQTSGWWRTYGLSGLLLLGLGVFILFLYREFAVEQRLVDRISQLEARIRPVDAQLETSVPSELSASLEAATQRLVAIERKLSDLSANQDTVIGRFSETLEQLSKISERLALLEGEFSDLTAVWPPFTNENTVAMGTAHEDMFLHHKPGKGETLWSIAKRYYDSGRFYPVLLECNPGLGIYFDPSYGRVKVLKDRQLANQVLTEVTVVRGNRTLIRYKVVEGDTWERISERFFGHVRNVGELVALNPSADLVAGDRVLVPLS